MAPDINEKLLEELSSLPDNILIEIKKIIDEFKSGQKPAVTRLRFDDLFHTISEQDAKEMLEAIEDCERIGADGW
ncbi:MAG: hypothetical protein WCX65_09220 [bacterium]